MNRTQLNVGTGRYTGGAWCDNEGEYALHGFSLDGLTEGGPCPVNCSNDNEIYSFHSGGANIVLGDGSVHFLHSTVNITVAAALTTKAGGEVFNPSDY